MASSASMIDSCHGIALRSMCAALRPKCLTRASARWRCRLNTMTRVESLGDEPVDDRASAAAGAEDDGLARHLLLADQPVERDAEAGHVGVVADRAACPRA